MTRLYVFAAVWFVLLGLVGKVSAESETARLIHLSVYYAQSKADPAEQAEMNERSDKKLNRALGKFFRGCQFKELETFQSLGVDSCFALAWSISAFQSSTRSLRIMTEFGRQAPRGKALGYISRKYPIYVSGTTRLMFRINNMNITILATPAPSVVTAVELKQLAPKLIDLEGLDNLSKEHEALDRK